ncbi:hypothetical protein PIB30_005494 [Stylosanthes scabra]|uniref:non-specific serine/threonine protein kinase n=1 Tax=Stylosanthes scabra TaxID=79078 RepID=A0ABU6Z2S8_9FABA|nr:hypothetical protein [Stylosanthes scabra]
MTQYVFFLLFITAYSSSSSLASNETDLVALLKFKESITNDPSQVLISWNTSNNHFCNWHGVTCGRRGRRNQRVTGLDLQGSHLHGFISPYLGNLSFLTLLNLGGNSFYGHVPQELGRLSQLQTLFLTNNTLEGEFPKNLTNCFELRLLNLQNNHFIGQIPMEIGSLTKLEGFYVDKNNLTGKIPDSIANISSLSVLSMAYNNLEGNIPDSIFKLKVLTKLQVGANNLSGTFPSAIYNLSSLTFLSIAMNQYTGFLLSNMFVTLSNLKTMYIGGNQLSGRIPSSVSNASKIQVFDIYLNHFSGEIPQLGKLQDLSLLKLGENNFSGNLADKKDGEFLRSLINCTKLLMLDIDTNNFSGNLPSFMGNLSTTLTSVYLGGNQIHGQIPKELGNLVNLILLTMENNHLTGTIPTSFSKLTKMQFMALEENNLFGEIPSSISNLSQLFRLGLGSNMLSGNIPSTLANCKNLQQLYLSYNNLSGHIPSSLMGLSSLLILNVSHNSLSGNLPVEVGKLSNLGVLDLSMNFLSGSIPESIGECVSLEILDLHGNSFNGGIPPSLASLKVLQVLDLSRNDLSGTIPQELQNLTSLQYLNASFNMLEGEVPKNGVFQNTSAFSVANNSNLCGGVSELKLPPCRGLKDSSKRKHNNLKIIVGLTTSLIAIFLLLSCFYVIYKKQRKQRREEQPSNYSAFIELPKVSYKDLHHATDGFSNRNLIGVGSFGSVYKGILESDLVAIKVLNLERKGAHKSFVAECNALRNIRHRNLVKILTCCTSVDHNGNDFKALVLEFMSNRSLEEWLHGDTTIISGLEELRPLNLKERLDVINGVASAMKYLHYECVQPIIHCDLKPSNVLLDKEMVAHVSDFGLARIVSAIQGNTHDQTSTIGIKGTIGYAPPEYGISSRVSKEGDAYSFGIMLLEILTGTRPTEEIFKDGNNLHRYVQNAFPIKFLEIVDPSLLHNLEHDEYPSSKESQSGDNNNLLHWQNLDANKKCLFSLFKIGLACSLESPEERMNMIEVTRELSLIHVAYN